jgi:hypothetical protein
MRLRISDDVVFQDLAGEAVILDLATGTYFGLDPVGTRIWHLLAEHGGLEPVVAALLAEYDVPEGELRRDLAALLDELRDRGLVRADAA